MGATYQRDVAPAISDGIGSESDTPRCARESDLDKEVKAGTTLKDASSGYFSARIGTTRVRVSV